MRILFFIESLRAGGKERRLVELIKGLVARTNIAIELVLTRKDVHYTEVFSSNIKMHYIERRFVKKDPRLFFAFYDICKKFNPDIIHVWGNMAAIYAIPTKVLQRKTIINSQITNAPRNVQSGILRHKLTFPFSDYIVANSKAGLNAYRAPAYKSTYIHNGFDFERLSNISNENQVREQFGIETEKVVGMVATFYEKKDYNTYLNAANIVLEKRQDITFLCVGAGDSSRYGKLVKDEYLDNVKFLGRQKEVESIMAICDVGVLSTFTEGLPNSVMEFMALGKPVVATDGGGTKELLVDGETGFLIRQRAAETLADKLIYLLTHKKEATEMGNNGRQRVKQEFSLDNMVERYIELYEIAHQGGDVSDLSWNT